MVEVLWVGRLDVCGRWEDEEEVSTLNGDQGAWTDFGRQMCGNNMKITGEERWFKDGVDVDEVEISEAHW